MLCFGNVGVNDIVVVFVGVTVGVCVTGGVVEGVMLIDYLFTD